MPKKLPLLLVLLLIAVVAAILVWPRPSPASGEPLTGIVAVAAGWGHTCALTTAGGLKCWGDNSSGELGDGTTTQRTTPVDVVGLSSGAAAVAAGASYTCALTTAGGVKCWGGTYHTPVDVVGLGSGVAAVAAGASHTCALTAAGGVKCWGWNAFGQLGDGTTTNRTTPVDVVGLSSGVAAITAGERHTCALTTAGGVECWGFNFFGQLGDGTFTGRQTPVEVCASGSGNTCTPLTGVAAVSAGSSHTCAVTTAGGLKCWGGNNYGQLGDGQSSGNVGSPRPVNVSGLGSGVVDVAPGLGLASALFPQHTCAATVTGAKCWGANGSGQLGTSTTAICQRFEPCSTTPVDVCADAACTSALGGVPAVGAGFYHTCALTTASGVKCWGANYAGQLGDGTTTTRLTPVDVVVGAEPTPTPTPNCDPGVDTDGDGFDDDVECYLGTDPLDACRDDPSDAAWPLDVNNDGQVSVVGDVLNFRGRIGATPGHPNWSQRLDFNADRQISVVGDVLMYRGRIGETCT